jgi:hypothetical protein
LKECAQLGWCQAGHGADLTIEVRLVGVPALDCDPQQASRPGEHAHGALEAGDPSDGSRRQANLPLEPELEVTPADAQLGVPLARATAPHPEVELARDSVPIQRPPNVQLMSD